MNGDASCNCDDGLSPMNSAPGATPLHADVEGGRTVTRGTAPSPANAPHGFGANTINKEQPRGKHGVGMEHPKAVHSVKGLPNATRR